MLAAVFSHPFPMVNGLDMGQIIVYAANGSIPRITRWAMGWTSRGLRHGCAETIAQPLTEKPLLGAVDHVKQILVEEQRKKVEVTCRVNNVWLGSSAAKIWRQRRARNRDFHNNCSRLPQGWVGCPASSPQHVGTYTHKRTQSGHHRSGKIAVLMTGG